MSADHPIRVHVTEALRVYIEVNNLLCSNPQSIRSSPPPDNDEGRAYRALRREYMAAYADLWAVTDFEYEEDGFRDVCWDWRYWKVMARKCCWYQSHAYVPEPDLTPSNGFTLHRFDNQFDAAAATMKKLHEAEAAMVRACGLWDIYRPPCSFIEDHFPNLKKT